MAGLPFDAGTSRRIEAMYRSPDAIRRRSLVLQLLQPRSGERILDIGCGPGFLAAELGAAVGPAGAVEAIDSSEAMLELARTRCAAQPWVRVRPGDAAHLDLPAGELDAVVSVQVHEYVKDAAGSLGDAFRALRPGGRALVVATDWDSIVWASSDPERMRRVLSAFDEHLAHPHLPRQLRPLLTRLGFDVRRCDVLVQLNEVLDANTFSYGLLDLVHRFVPGRRGVTPAEADAWAEDLRELGRRGEYFFSLNQYVFLATKP
ncbi:MAG TPA: methyltransferase domain-containing protein [Gemmatimonadales bacterium]|nr:methyltransferase domain-containing protein [Gemmatimonadales bacterium]